MARRGELDLVCRRGAELVVVEVKTRTDDSFGTPLEAVGSRKRRALMSAAAEYRALAGWRGAIRYAVVGLTVKSDGGFRCELIEDPFD
jgi:putative endonuclease